MWRARGVGKTCRPVLRSSRRCRRGGWMGRHRRRLPSYRGNGKSDRMGAIWLIQATISGPEKLTAATDRAAARRKKWSERRDLNPRPLHPQCSALPSCATLRHPAPDGVRRRARLYAPHGRRAIIPRGGQGQPLGAARNRSRSASSSPSTSASSARWRLSRTIPSRWLSSSLPGVLPSFRRSSFCTPLIV